MWYLGLVLLSLQGAAASRAKASGTLAMGRVLCSQECCSFPTDDALQERLFTTLSHSLPSFHLPFCLAGLPFPRSQV